MHNALASFALFLGLVTQCFAGVVTDAIVVKKLVAGWDGPALVDAASSVEQEAAQAVAAALEFNLMTTGTAITFARDHLAAIRQSGLRTLNPDGKVVIALDMTKTFGRSPPEAGVLELPKSDGAHVVYLVVGAQGLSLYKTGKPDELKRELADALLKPAREMVRILGQIRAVISYNFSKGGNEGELERKLSSFRFYASGDAGAALRDGLALARECYWMGQEVEKFTGQDLFAGTYWYPRYRRVLPRARQAMCHLLLRARQTAGAGQLERQGWLTSGKSADGVVDRDDWYHPVFVPPSGPVKSPLFASGAPTLRTEREMNGCEAVVAFILLSLFQADAWISKPIKKMVQEGAGDFSTVYRNLLAAEKDPKRRDFLKWTVGMRTLGAYVDSGAAVALVAERMKRRITMPEFDKRLRKLIAGSDEAPRVVAVPLKDQLLSARYASPADRVRIILDHFGTLEAHALMSEAESNYALAHYSESLIDGVEDASAFKSLNFALEHLSHAEAWQQVVTHISTEQSWHKVEPDVKKLVGRVMNRPQVHAHHAPETIGGGVVKYFVASVLVHHLFIQDYSHWSNRNLSFNEKVARTARELFSLHAWNRQAVLSVALGTTVFAVGMVIGRLLAWKAVLVGTVISSIYELFFGHSLSQWIADKWDESENEAVSRNMADVIRYWVHYHVDERESLPSDNRNLRTILEADRHLFAHFLDAHPSADGWERRQAILRAFAGWSKSVIEANNKLLGIKLRQLDDFVQRAVKPVRELERKFAHAVNPFRGHTSKAEQWEQERGYDDIQWRMATYLFAEDEDGNIRSPEETADWLVVTMVSNAAVAKRVGPVELEDAGALDRLHAQALRVTRGVLLGTPASKIHEMHEFWKSRVTEDVTDLTRDMEEAKRDVAAELKSGGLDKLRAIRDHLAMEARQIDGYRLAEIESVHARPGERPMAAPARQLIDSLKARRAYLGTRIKAFDGLLRHWNDDPVFDARRLEGAREAE